MKKFNLLVENCPDTNTKSFFKEKNIVQGLRQPKNILRQLPSARFVTDIPPTKPNCNYKCVDKRCKICAQYLVECKEVIGSNGAIWKIPSHITWQSKLVLYFLVIIYYQIVIGFQLSMKDIPVQIQIYHYMIHLY